MLFSFNSVSAVKYIFFLIHGEYNLFDGQYILTFRILPVVKFQTSMKPSTDPVIKYCPSGENRAHSTWDFRPNCIIHVHTSTNRKRKTL